MAITKKQTILFIVIFVLSVTSFLIIRRLSFRGNVTIEETLKTSGFIALSPPSNLVYPGTWVTVLNRQPLHLGVVCTPNGALGLPDTSRLLKSNSADLETITKLQNSFDLSSTILEKLQLSSRYNEVKSISFQLKNIQILEIPDAVVMETLKDRDPYCKDAIRNRLDNGEALSMIKSALIADVTYRIEFNRKLENQSAAEVKKKLALDLNLQMQTAEDGTSSVFGRNLIWGVREDATLATAGIKLAPTGSSSPRLQVITNLAEIQNVVMESTRKNFSDKESIVKHHVTPLRQPHSMACWATVYTMMRSWEDNIDELTVGSAIGDLGSPWTEFYLNNQGLPAEEQSKFVERIGMKTMPPANYTIDAYIDMLRESPLWIITGDGISSHARLLVGIYGNRTQKEIAAHERTTFEFIDPAQGTFRYETGLEFVQKFESEARWLVDEKFDDIELRHQILFW